MLRERGMAERGCRVGRKGVHTAVPERCDFLGRERTRLAAVILPPVLEPDLVK